MYRTQKYTYDIVILRYFSTFDAVFQCFEPSIVPFTTPAAQITSITPILRRNSRRYRHILQPNFTILRYHEASWMPHQKTNHWKIMWVRRYFNYSIKLLITHLPDQCYLASMSKLGSFRSSTILASQLANNSIILIQQLSPFSQMAQIMFPCCPANIPKSPMLLAELKSFPNLWVDQSESSKLNEQSGRNGWQIYLFSMPLSLVSRFTDINFLALFPVKTEFSNLKLDSTKRWEKVLQYLCSEPDK